MGELPLPEADEHIGSARHPRVNGVMSQEETERRIVRIRGHAADHVARVNILQVDLDPSFLEVRSDTVSQENADVPESYISGSVSLLG